SLCGWMHGYGCEPGVGTGQNRQHGRGCAEGGGCGSWEVDFRPRTSDLSLLQIWDGLWPSLSFLRVLSSLMSGVRRPFFTYDQALATSLARESGKFITAD